MKSYELVVIFKADQDSSVLENETTKIRNLIESHKGSIDGIEDWGRREIAFEIKKHKQGHYQNFRFDCEDGSVVDALNKILRISESVLKFQTHRVDSSERAFKGNPASLKDSEAA